MIDCRTARDKMLFGLAAHNPHDRIPLMISATLGSHPGNGHAVIGVFKSKKKDKLGTGREEKSILTLKLQSHSKLSLN